MPSGVRDVLTRDVERHMFLHQLPARKKMNTEETYSGLPGLAILESGFGEPEM